MAGTILHGREGSGTIGMVDDPQTRPGTMILPSDPANPLMFPQDAMAEIGAAHREAYRRAEPFPMIAFDDFLDRRVLDTCLAHFPPAPGADTFHFDNPRERAKWGFSPERLHPDVRTIFYSFNARPFVTFLEALTGIEGLIPDPYFGGGGFHELKTGGYLDIHADFNFHPILRTERRLNVLIYLNEGWLPEHGGRFEAWNADRSACVRRIVPLYNRCVVFDTSKTSFHGNPEPVAHPDGRPRRSIALYYYTAHWNEAVAKHSTLFEPAASTDSG
jgi:hypothetical protein